MTGDMSAGAGAGTNVEDSAVDCDDLFIDDFGIVIELGWGIVGVVG